MTTFLCREWPTIDGYPFRTMALRAILSLGLWPGSDTQSPKMRLFGELSMWGFVYIPKRGPTTTNGISRKGKWDLKPDQSIYVP